MVSRRYSNCWSRRLDLFLYKGAGSVVFGHIVSQRLEWKNYEATIVDDGLIYIYEIVHGNEEKLEFKDRIVKASLGYGYLIVATSVQSFIYSHKNWNTTAGIDISNNGRVTCIVQCDTKFALVDTFNGIQVFTYDGRLCSCIKYPGLRPEFITPYYVSISSELLAVKDKVDEKGNHNRYS